MIPHNKKIAVLHPYVNNMWGAVKMMIYLSNILKKNNNELVFYTLSYDKLVFSDEKINFLIKSYYSRSSILKFFSLLIIAYNIRRVDYIVIWNSPMHFVWVLSKLLFFSKAKIIWWNHHYPWYYSKNANLYIKLKRYIEKIFISKVDKVVSNSQYLKSIIDKIWTINSEVLNPILDEEFLHCRTNIDKKENILFSYSRWTPDKNLDILFKTYESLKDSFSDLQLWIWGDWEDVDKFKLKYIKDNNVKFLWSLVKKQIIKNLNMSKIFLFPSKNDSFWIVKLEALSLWVPVICFDNGYEEIIINSNNWFCVKSENDFIEKTKLILNDFNLYNNLKLNIRNNITKYDSQNFEKQLNNIFEF